MPICENLSCRTFLALLTAAVAVLPACSPNAESTLVLEPTVDLVDGVEMLTYPASGAPRLSWSFDTTVVLGGFDVDDTAYEFGGLVRTSLAGDDQGNLYVLDRDGARVLGYGPGGAFLGSWGREGSGPGEFGVGIFGGPRSLAVGPGDTLWVHDEANQRFTKFALSDHGSTSTPLPPSVQGIGGQMSIDSTGVVVLLTTMSFAAGGTGDAPAPPLVKLGRDGEPTDTLWVAPAPERRIIGISGEGGRNMLMMLSRVFSPGFSWARFEDGGLAIQEVAEYEIRIVDDTGTLRRVIRRVPPPRQVTEQDRRRYLDSLLAPPDQQTSFNSEIARRQRAEATEFANVVPRIVTPRRDRKDRLWVGVSEREAGVIERIDVYDADLHLLGELHGIPMPDHFFGDGYAAIIDTDELGVQRIQVMRLVEGADSPESVAPD